MGSSFCFIFGPHLMVQGLLCSEITHGRFRDAVEYHGLNVVQLHTWQVNALPYVISLWPPWTLILNLELYIPMLEIEETKSQNPLFIA